MARISTYELDTTVQTTDKFLGSNADGTVKNFKMSDVSTYLRSTNSAGVGGQLAFVYHDSNNNGFGTRQPGTITFDAGGASVVALSGITTIKISKFPNGSNNSAVSLINTLLNTNIILSDTEDQDQFGVYQVTAIAQDSDETNFYDLSLSLVGSLVNGNLNNLNSYSISVFTAGDKNFVSNQLNFSAGSAQTITHNLGKFPSVTVVDSNGKQVVGEVQHTSVNALTVTFQNAFAAKVYVN